MVDDNIASRSGRRALEGASSELQEAVKALKSGDNDAARVLFEAARRFAEAEGSLVIRHLELRAPSGHLRVLAADRQGRPPGPEASMLKIKGTEIQQALTERGGGRANEAELDQLITEIAKTV